VSDVSSVEFLFLSSYTFTSFQKDLTIDVEIDAVLVSIPQVTFTFLKQCSGVGYVASVELPPNIQCYTEVSSFSAFPDKAIFTS